MKPIITNPSTGDSQTPMLYFSSLLQSHPSYRPAAERLFAVLDTIKMEYRLIDGTRDIWVRDFMPVQRHDGSFVSFRYEPGYLKNNPELQTDYRQDLSAHFTLPVTYSQIHLDGGNVVFSPSKKKVIISDRVLAENPDFATSELILTLEQQLQAQVILIPSLKSDMTGHADGMVRFIDETTVIGNHVPAKNGLEQRIQAVLRTYGIHVIDFPYFYSPKGSAVGCYLNFLQTPEYLFLPVFGVPMDTAAIVAAQQLFSQIVIPVNIHEIALDGGLLNCISWEIT